MPDQQIGSFPDAPATLPSSGVYAHVVINGLDKKATPAQLQQLPLTVVNSNTGNIENTYNGQTVRFDNTAHTVKTLPLNLPEGYTVRLQSNTDYSVSIRCADGVLVNGLAAPIVLAVKGDFVDIRVNSINNLIAVGSFSRSYIEFITTKASGSFSVFGLTNGGDFGVQWWDGTITTAASNTTPNKTIPNAGTRRVRVYPINALNGLTGIIANDNGLVAVKTRNLPVLQSLNLHNNSLASFTIEETPSLTTLRLDNNPLTNVDLSRAPKITNLNLSYTNIVKLQSDGLNSLYTLFLTGTKIVAFSGTGFANLNQLDLTQCALLAAFSGVGMPGLKLLNISSTNLEYLDTTGLYSLETLFFSAMPELTEFNGKDLRKVTEIGSGFCPKLATLTNFPKVNTGAICSIDFTNCNLNAAQLTALYNAVGNAPTGSSKGITTALNPGAGVSKTPATSKGWTVIDGF